MGLLYFVTYCNHYLCLGAKFNWFCGFYAPRQTTRVTQSVLQSFETVLRSVV